MGQPNFEQLESINTDDLDRTKDFGKIVDFKQIKTIFERLREFVLRFTLNGEPNPNLSQSIQNAVTTKVNELIQQKSQVDSLSGENINSLGTSILQTLINLENQAKDQLGPHLFSIATDLKDLTDQAKDSEQSAKKINDLEKQASAIVSKLEKFEKQGSQKASKQAVGELSQEFLDDANEGWEIKLLKDKKLTIKTWELWLFVAIVFLALILATISCKIPWWIEKNSFSEFIMFDKKFQIPLIAITKFLLIGFFGAGLQFCLSNYKTTKHLNTVNHFRARVLNAFERIVADDNIPLEIKTQILKDSSTAIFNLNDSGYLGKKENKGNVSIPINTKLG